MTVIYATEIDGVMCEIVEIDGRFAVLTDGVECGAEHGTNPMHAVNLAIRHTNKGVFAWLSGRYDNFVNGDIMQQELI
jgi:hypothetical protein